MTNTENASLETVPGTIQGVEILADIEPANIDEFCVALRGFQSEKTAVFPGGGNLSQTLGYPPSRPGVLLRTTRLSQVIDYPHEDMTITVETGIRMSELAAILANKGQELPIDVPDADKATLGGLLATNHSGPRRYGHGTLRDYVLGIEVVYADGTRVHGGGRVVKNVAGYDFMKLHTGALGTLGVISQVTLKLKPLPEARAGVVVTLPAALMEPVLDHLTRSKTRPVAIELLDERALAQIPHISGVGPWGLILLFEESTVAVDWQLTQIANELATLGVDTVTKIPREHYAQLLSGLTHWTARQKDSAVFKANQLPGRVTSFCQLMKKQLPDSACLAHAGNGIIWTTVPSTVPWLTIGQSPLRRFAEDGIGNVVVDQCPIEWKAEAPIWGAPRPDWKIMQKLKLRLDPDNILNPGRFVAF